MMLGPGPNPMKYHSEVPIELKFGYSINSFYPLKPKKAFDLPVERH